MFRSHKLIRTTTVCTLTLALTTAVVAQQREFAEAQRANQAALRQYSWKSRTELKVNGNSGHVRLEQVRYDFDGRLQKTIIGGGQAAAESQAGRRGGGPLKKHVVAKKKEEFGEMLEDLAALAESYGHVPSDRMFAARAAITRGQGIETGSVRIQGRDVLTIGDEMTLWVDPATFAMRRVEIVASYEGDPVRIAADYRTLESGLTYQARSSLRYPARQIEVVVETFDYVGTATR